MDGVLLSQALFPFAVRADDAGGHITVLRTIPAHDAFRRGDAGTPSNVSTAPEALSDAAMGAVDGQGQSVKDVTAASSALSGPMATTLGNTTSTINNNRAQVPVGGAGVTDAIMQWYAHKISSLQLQQLSHGVRNTVPHDHIDSHSHTKWEQLDAEHA